MASAEIKVAVIALLILAVGFFYTNVHDKMTGYIPAQKPTGVEQYGFTEGESYQVAEPDQTLLSEQPDAPSKELTEEKGFLQELFSGAQPGVQFVDPCSNDVPQQLLMLVRGAC